MKTIGVDAGMLGITDPRLQAGVWRVAVHALRALSTFDTVNHYRLYSFDSIPTKLLNTLGKNMKNVVLRPTYGWMTFRLPYELIRRPVDIFLGLSQALPFGPGKKVGIVYDLAFMHFPQSYPESYNKLLTQTNTLVKRASTIVTISESTKRDLISHYALQLANIQVVYPGVDGIFTHLGDKSTHAPYILFVGALKKSKNVPMALKLFSEYRKRYDQTLRFVIVGGNYWEDHDIRKAIDKLKIKDVVMFKGVISDEELAIWYRGARALLITSLWEGFCFPAVEAMRSGCPVLYAPTGALPEVVGDAGVQLDLQSVEANATLLQKVLTESVYRNTLIEKGLAKSKLYSWDAFGKALYSIVNS